MRSQRLTGRTADRRRCWTSGVCQRRIYTRRSLGSTRTCCKSLEHLHLDGTRYVPTPLRPGHCRRRGGRFWLRDQLGGSELCVLISGCFALERLREDGLFEELAKNVRGSAGCNRFDEIDFVCFWQPAALVAIDCGAMVRGMCDRCLAGRDPI